MSPPSLSPVHGSHSYLGRSHHVHAHMRLYFWMVLGLKCLIHLISPPPTHTHFSDYLIHRERCQLQARRSAKMLKVITSSHKFPANLCPRSRKQAASASFTVTMRSWCWSGWSGLKPHQRPDCCNTDYAATLAAI